MPLTIELPSRKSLAEFNRRRWSELSADSSLASLEGRIETDRYGHIIKSPPPSAFHGSLQAEICFRLRTLLPTGRTITECPISTSDGVKATDVGWFSSERFAQVRHEACFSTAPDICAEVLSSSNTVAEMREKMALYFEAGAAEVWMCLAEGKVEFYLPDGGTPPQSALCPEFPRTTVLP